MENNDLFWFTEQYSHFRFNRYSRSSTGSNFFFLFPHFLTKILTSIYLNHVDEVDITFSIHLLHELDELLLEPLVGLQPGGVEV